MGLFNWSAPLFKHFADRWSDEEIAVISDVLRPYVGPGARLLDVGGGTGALARRLQTRLGAEITILDPTPEMLSHVPVGEHIRAVLGKAEAIPFEAATFDAVIVTDAFHHFEDQSRALHEFARVMRPGGAVVILEFDPRNTVIRLIRLFELMLGEPGTFVTPEELGDMMAEHGFVGRCVSKNSASYRFVGTVERLQAY
jgi:ubiquinone/menaquinone biosynthesis C-methylase UbiE